MRKQKHAFTIFKNFKHQVDEEILLGHIREALQAKKHYLAVSLPLPPIDVLAVIEQSRTTYDFQFYWEKPIDDFAIAAGGELASIHNTGVIRFRASSTQGKELLSTVHHFSTVPHSNAVVHLFGGFSFFDENTSQTWNEFKAASFTLPAWTIIREGQTCMLTLCIPISDLETEEAIHDRFEQALINLDPICNVTEYQLPEPHRAQALNHLISDQDLEHIHWIETIERAKDQIYAGTFSKVVLARELVLRPEEPIQDTFILNKLRHQYPDCYSFLIRHSKDASFIGSTPERLASFQGNFVLTEGLAGSISRGKNASEDVMLEHELLTSEKDIHEQSIVLEAIKHRLEPFSKEINHPEAPSIKKLSNVQHLYTPIRASMKDGVSRTEVLKSLHPTPAVGGFPRQEAVDFIRKHENFDRGWYAAPLGWINANGNSEFVVAIRSGLIKKEEVRFFAGCGIVQNSDPEKEWEETNMKFIPMLSALNYAAK